MMKKEVCICYCQHSYELKDYGNEVWFLKLSDSNTNGGSSNLRGDPQLGLINHSDPVGLASTVWGGAVSAELLRLHGAESI